MNSSLVGWPKSQIPIKTPPNPKLPKITLEGTE
jgi:hypothetical protein